MKRDLRSLYLKQQMADERPRSERHRRHSDASPELIPHTRHPTLLRCRRRQLRLPANRRIRQALAC
jgi:hypothetical protein